MWFRGTPDIAAVLPREEVWPLGPTATSQGIRQAPRSECLLRTQGVGESCQRDDLHSPSLICTPAAVRRVTHRGAPSPETFPRMNDRAPGRQGRGVRV
jgi:hypothetical protein